MMRTKTKAGIALKAPVIRHGHEETIEARDRLPGDIAIIEVRGMVRADY